MPRSRSCERRVEGRLRPQARVLGRLQGFRCERGRAQSRETRREPGQVRAALLGPELPLATAFAKVEARSLVADAAVKVAVLSALRGLLVEAGETAGALSLEP